MSAQAQEGSFSPLLPRCAGAIETSCVGSVILPVQAPMSMEEMLAVSGCDTSSKLLGINPKLFPAQGECFGERVIEFFSMRQRRFTLAEAMTACTNRGLGYPSYTDCVRVAMYDPERQTLRAIMFPHFPVGGRSAVPLDGKTLVLVGRYDKIWRAIFAVDAKKPFFGDLVAGVRIEKYQYGG